MKLMILVLTLTLMACGSSKGGSASSSVIGNGPQPSPTPSNPYIGVWQGQDYSAMFQDLWTFNSDGTGSMIACSWTFDWVVDPNNIQYPNTLDITNTQGPDSTPGDECYANAGLRRVALNIINSTTFSGPLIGNNYNFTYFKQ